MKFYCHRCNKPYLIADERVRGKILKIRCKNCSAVITVREGMDQSAPPGRRSNKRQSTASGPEPGRLTPDPSAPDRAGAAVAASRSTPAPGGRTPTSSPEMVGEDLPLLDDDWYLSVDGEQEGPFPIERAREWVSAREPEDEVYCWRDGFEDWLPVDDVPEFQGARRHSRLALMPPPATPTPDVPASASAPAPQPPPPDALPGGFGSAPEDAMTTVEPGPYALIERGLLPADDQGESAAEGQSAASDDRGSAPSSQRLAPPADVAAGGSQPDAAAEAWPSEGGSGPELAGGAATPYPSLADVQGAPLAGAGPPPSGDPAGTPRRRWPGILLGIALLLGVAGGGVAAYYFVLDDPGAFLGGGARSGLSPLTPGEVSAELQAPGNQRALKECYERARQRDPALDVDRIDVELDVDAAGRVTRVSLSEHQGTALGACLVENIRTWSFRESADGLSTRVPLIFAR